VALFIGLWSVSASILRRFRQHLEGFSASRVLPVVSVLGAILVSRISWEPIAGFRTIVQFGEDNGAWLNNIALSLESSGSWSPAVGTSGGALLASIITAMTSLVDSSTLFRWNLTEVIDLQGRDVQPNFDYLVNDPLDSPNPEYADVLTNFQSGG